MMYPKGSKQPRQVWGAVMNVYKAPPSDVVVTPTPTPSPTTTLTSTPTPSPTTTLTSTPTQTSTPTNTLTSTPTQTQTPSNTPNPLCPQQLDIVGGPLYPGITGTYNRLSVAPTQTFTSGYIQQQGSPDTFVFGTAPDGKNYAAFGYQAGGASYMFARNFNGASGLGWVQYVTSGGYLYEGGTIAQVGGSNTNTGFLFDGSVYYPATGQFTIGAGANYYYLSYPLSCPTPTPTSTPTQTSTPTTTLTSTPTPSPTTTLTSTPNPTTTPTPTNTPSPSAPASGTTEANEFLARVVATGGTLNSTISAATQTMFTSLVSTGLWEDISIFYPIIGGVANAHSQAAGQQYSSSYNGIFNGGVTHSSSGMTFNGVNGYMDTNWALTNQLGSTSLVSIGGYTNTTYVESLMGCLNGDASTITQLRLDVPVGQIAPQPGTTLAGANTTAMTGSSGTFITSRTGTTATFVLQNNVITNLTQASGLTDSNRVMWVGARNYAGAPAYGTGRVAFVFMGRTLTAAKATTLKGIIQTFQTSLSRQV